MLVAGISRGDRLDALSLLGLLGDHADKGGVVRLPLSTLAGEFSMSVPRARRLLAILVEVGAVAPDREGLAVVAWQPSAAEGLRLAGFLANVATVFDHERLHGDTLLPDASVLPSRRRPVAAHGRHRRPREPVFAALAGLAALLAVLLAPWSTPPTSLRTVPSASSPSPVDEGPGPTRPPAPPESAEPTAAGPPASADVVAPRGVDAVDREEQPPGDSPAVVGTLLSTPAAGEVATGGGPRALPDDGGPPLGGPVGRRPTAPDAAPAPPPPSPRPRDTPDVGSPDDVGSDTISCPAVEAPYVIVASILVGPGPTDALAGLGAPSIMEVSGTVVNPSGDEVVVELFEINVDLGDGRATLTGSPSPLTLPAQRQHFWRMTTTVPAGSTLSGSDVDGRVVRWSWLDEALAEACPT